MSHRRLSLLLLVLTITSLNLCQVSASPTYTARANSEPMPKVMRRMPTSHSDPVPPGSRAGSNERPLIYYSTQKPSDQNPSARTRSGSGRERTTSERQRDRTPAPMPREVLSPPDITKAAKDLLDHIAEAQSEEEYSAALALYEEFKKSHKDSGVCLPQAPGLVPSSFPNKLTPAQKACKKGYRIGWSHGKKWAQIVVRDREKKSVGEDHLQCLLGYLEPGNIDPKMVCAYKAARASYDKWYRRLTDPKAQAEYKSYKQEEPSTLVEVEPPRRRRISPSEVAFVQSLGLTPDLS